MITFYPTISRGEMGKYAAGVSRALLPASSWASAEVLAHGRVRGKIAPVRLPASIVDGAADCGGFVATRKWGTYRYNDSQYVEWCDGWRPSWAAMMDYCCEDEITSGQPGIVRKRQDDTTAMAHHFWQQYRSASWSWVPTIQGWTVEDYRRHVQDMKPLITEMSSHYGAGSAFRVGIGTLCARASAKMIREVVTMVASELPDVSLHLWGVKLSVMQSQIMLPEQVASVDSGAWNGMWGHGRNHWKATGMTQREWCFKVALPAYEAKINAALCQPKQATLLEEVAS